MTTMQVDAQQWMALMDQVTALKSEVSGLKTRPSTPRPVWSIKNRASGDGVTSAAAAVAKMVTDMPAAGAVLSIEDGTYLLDQDITIPSHVQTIVRDGMIRVPAGVTVTLNGPLDAPRAQIFDVEEGGQVIGSPRIAAAYPEWFGADPADGVDSRKGFMDTFTLVSRGGRIEAQPGGVYRFDGDEWMTIRGSFITLDFQNSTIYSKFRTRLQVLGEPRDADGNPIPGGPRGVRHVHIKNVTVGGPDHALDNIMRGIDFSWCEDCSGENIHVGGPSGTSFNRFSCARVNYTNCIVTGGQTTRGSFGFLSHMTWDCQTTNCTVYDAVKQVSFQQKGGRNNTYTNCTTRNVTKGSLTHQVAALWDRGDAPWKDSNTLSTGLIYPFADLGWGVPDPRRASYNTRWVNCTAEDCPDMNGSIAQEAVGTTWENCVFTNMRTAIVMLKNDNTDEHNADGTLLTATLAGATNLFLSEVDDAQRFNVTTGIHPVGVGTWIAIELNTGFRDVVQIAAVPARTTGTVTVGSTIITHVANMNGWVLDGAIRGDGIPAGAVVIGINTGASQLTISDPATASGVGVALTGNVLAITPGLSSDAAAGKALFAPRQTMLAADAIAGALSVDVISTSGIAVSDLFTILLNDGTPFTTPTTSVAGSTIGLTDPLPSAANKGQEATKAIIGQEADFTVNGGRAETLRINGVTILGQKSSYLDGVKVNNFRIITTGSYGIYAEYAANTQISRTRVTNPNENNVAGTDGIFFIRCHNPTLEINIAEDLRSTPLMSRGIRMSSGVTMIDTNADGITDTMSNDSRVVYPTLIGNQVLGGWVTRALQSFQVGNYANNFPGDGYRTNVNTTTTQTDIWRCELPEYGQIVRIEARVHAKAQNHTGQASWYKRAVFRNVGKAVTSIAVTNGGAGYTSVPTVTITGGGAATNAIATAVRNAGTNTITSINITDEGTFYTGIPTVTISGGGGAGATATATITDRVRQEGATLDVDAAVLSGVASTGPWASTFSSLGTTIRMNNTGTATPIDWKMDMKTWHVE